MQTKTETSPVPGALADGRVREDRQTFAELLSLCVCLTRIRLGALRCMKQVAAAWYPGGKAGAQGHQPGGCHSDLCDPDPKSTGWPPAVSEVSQS